MKKNRFTVNKWLSSQSIRILSEMKFDDKPKKRKILRKKKP